MILRVDTQTWEAQTHATGIIANLRSKLWTGEIPHYGIFIPVSRYSIVLFFRVFQYPDPGRE